MCSCCVFYQTISHLHRAAQRIAGRPPPLLQTHLDRPHSEHTLGPPVLSSLN